MKISDAVLCLDCDEVYVREEGFGCPVCTSRSFAGIAEYIKPLSTLNAGIKVNEKLNDEKPKRRKQQ